MIHKFIASRMESEQVKEWFSYWLVRLIRRLQVAFLCILPHIVYAQLSDTIPCPVTWGPTTQVSNTVHSAFAPKIIAKGDTVHSLYLAGGLYYRRSIDNGATWGQQAEIVPVDSMSGQLWKCPMAIVGKHVYVVWENRIATGFIRAVKMRRSTNGGETWEDPVELLLNTPSVEVFAEPLVAANGPYVYVTTVKQLPSGIWQYFLVRSTNSGAHSLLELLLEKGVMSRQYPIDDTPPFFPGRSSVELGVRRKSWWLAYMRVRFAILDKRKRISYNRQ